MRKRPTAADRPEFRRGVLDLVQKLGVQVGDPGPDAMVVCTRAADFDPRDNVLWELEANRCQVRDLKCSECGSPLAMSNELWGKYERADRKPKVVCVQCMVVIVERDVDQGPPGR